MTLPFLVALAFLLPLFQEFNDGILHLFGRVGLREVLPELFALKGHPGYPTWHPVCNCLPG